MLVERCSIPVILSLMALARRNRSVTPWRPVSGGAPPSEKLRPVEFEGTKGAGDDGADAAVLGRAGGE